MRTYIYVDGFNFYYGALKNTPCKWLDLLAFFANTLQPHHEILKVKYFTARVSDTPNNPFNSQRQDAYLRALQKHRTEIEVHLGHFISQIKNVKLVEPIANQRIARAYRTEEKGSDVNLAVHLLNDCWRNEYECAVVVSNDSDLTEALKIVKHQCGKMIGLVTPGKGRTSKQLKEHTDFALHTKLSVLKRSQLPDPIPGTNINKPVDW